MSLLRHSAVLGAFVLLSACAVFNTPPALPSRANITPGQEITVEGNQNVYAVARAHNVSMRDLIVINNLQPPFTLKPGQRLVLPVQSAGGGVTSSPSIAPAASIIAAPASKASTTAVEEVQLEPLHSSLPKPVARNNIQPSRVADNVSESMRAPPEPEPTKPSAKELPKEPVKQAVKEAPAKETPPVPKVNKSEALEPAPQKPVATTASPKTAKTGTLPANASKIDMVWPVQGPILSSYGHKGQGLSNDGINIGAPRGAPVISAANGVVVYAGNEMKGFGNLVLIRHEGGWVTAYAHLERTLVTKDVVVAQGDMIATVGKTGDVASPQLHFETRYDGKPVDPTAVIKR